MSEGDEVVRGNSASSEFESLHEIVRKAHQVLPKEKWDSLVGGAETETTLKRNRLAIDSERRPREEAIRDLPQITARLSLISGLPVGTIRPRGWADNRRQATGV